MESVVAATIETYRDRGYSLPPGVAPLEAKSERPSQLRVLDVSV